MLFRLSVLLLSTVSCASLWAQTVTAPQQVEQGGFFIISHAGANDPSDYVTLVAADAPPNKWEAYKYCRDGNNFEFRAPAVLGDYEVRLNRESEGIVLARSPLKVVPAKVTLSAPDEVAAAGTIQVQWQGPGLSGDFITLVEEGAGPAQYGSYVYTNHGPTITLPAPGTPGTYEIRYCSGAGSYALGKRLITVKSVEASLSAPDRVGMGEKVSIKWNGPAGDRLYVTIVDPGAKAHEYNDYQYLRAGNPLTLPAPEKPGTYEIRYNNESDNTVLARRMLIVDTVPVSITAAPSAVIGETMDIQWEGPANEGDFITVVPEGEPEGAYDAYVYVREGKNLQLKAPESPGMYELRYASGRKNYTLATSALEVIDTTATLTVPESHEAGQPMKVSFTGPANEQDYIAMVKKDDDPSKYLTYVYTREGSPVNLKTPFEPGDYKVYYYLGRSGRVLADATTKLTASNAPGSLIVTAKATSLADQKTAVSVILDASGSMLKRDGGKRRINVAKEAITKLVQSALPAGTPFAMRVFGHRQPNACQTDLEIPLGPLNSATVAQKVASIEAQNLAKTPIGASLEKVADDLAGHEGRALVVLITDGEETCDGDPAKALEKLKQAGFNVQVNIVGFALDEMGLKQTFRDWARLGNGRYFDAAKSEDLSDKLIAAVTPGFQVKGSDGSIVYEGEANGKPISLPVGNYQLQTLGGGKSLEFAIKPQETTRQEI